MKPQPRQCRHSEAKAGEDEPTDEAQRHLGPTAGEVYCVDSMPRLRPLRTPPDGIQNASDYVI